MKSLLAREFLFLFIAIIIALPVGVLFLHVINPPTQLPNPEDARVLEIDILLIGVLVGLAATYLARLVVWAAKKVIVSD